ncbi:MAG: alpha-glucosidase/alpha-galactosidase [Verrucomicrobia bacterium]|nr:alpha-glucosidase/alpha-galactosidase [Verrucomicrobiota bacterium]
MKIAVIGAGSIGFTRGIVRDILCIPELRDTVEFSFTDINQRNLDMVYQLCQRDMQANGVKSTLSATTNRRAALKDANYVFAVVRVGGLDAFKTDVDIPLKYGIDQCVGDTICAGGIMYAQRGIPVMLDFCKDISEVSAPGCKLITHVNPMAMLTWACNQYGSGVETIGLCHGVEGGARQIADVLKVPKSELDYICAGINHQTWFVQVRHKGRDMTGKLLKAFEKHPVYGKTEKVRIDMLRRFGYYSTESNGHLSEYVPWYRKRPNEIRDWIDMSSWINGETGGYLRVCTEGRSWFKKDFPNWMKADPLPYDAAHRGHEHGSYLIEGYETGRVYRGHFNVVNNDAITNLPADAIVEVPGYADGNGLSIPIVGDLPLGCAAVCNASISVQRMAMEAAVHGDDELLRQAMMMDPLVGAVCNPPEIWQMVDDMLVAQAQWLPQYKRAISAARRRIAKGPRLKTQNNKGAARLKVKSVTEMARNAKASREAAAAADKGEVDRAKARRGQKKA